jgi:hypothetical protein
VRRKHSELEAMICPIMWRLKYLTAPSISTSVRRPAAVVKLLKNERASGPKRPVDSATKATKALSVLKSLSSQGSSIVGVLGCLSEARSHISGIVTMSVEGLVGCGGGDGDIDESGRGCTWRLKAYVGTFAIREGRGQADSCVTKDSSQQLHEVGLNTSVTLCANTHAAGIHAGECVEARVQRIVFVCTDVGLVAE